MVIDFKVIGFPIDSRIEKIYNVAVMMIQNAHAVSL